MVHQRLLLKEGVYKIMESTAVLPGDEAGHRHGEGGGGGGKADVDSDRSVEL